MNQTVKKAILYNIITSLIFLGIVDSFLLADSKLLLTIYVISSTAVFVRLFYSEIKNFKGINLSMFVLAGYAMRLILPAITHTFDLWNGDKCYFEQNDVSDIIFPTIIWMNIYSMLFYYFLKKYSSSAYIEPFIIQYIEKYNISKLCIFVFVIGTLYSIITSSLIVGVIPFMVATILGGLTSLAIMLQMLNTALRYEQRKYTLFVCFIIIEIARTLIFGFYKTPIMLALAFYVLYKFLDSKYNNTKLFSTGFISSCLFFVVFLSYVVYPFMTIKRIEASWDVTEGGIVNSSYSNFDILFDVLSGNNKYEHVKTSTSDRLDAVLPNAFYYQYTKQSGFYNREFLIDNLQGVVPRFLNPNKHETRAGRMATALSQTGDWRNFDIMFTNSYIGRFSSSYMIGGSIMVILLAILTSIFIAKYWSFLVSNLNNLIAMVLFAQLLLKSINAFEETHDGGISECIIFLTYMVLIFILQKLKLFNHNG